MDKQSITPANLEKFVLSSIALAKIDTEPSLIALATVAAQTVVTEAGGSADVEAVATEWARHTELKSIAAAKRESVGNTQGRALEAIGRLAAAKGIEEGIRLSLIQRLSQWTPETAENLDQLIGEVSLPELPLTFEQSWARAIHGYDTLPSGYEGLKELGKRVWNTALDVTLATAQPVAEELIDSLDAIRRDYVKHCSDVSGSATGLTARIAAAMETLDYLSIPYAKLEPAIEVMSESKGNVACTYTEKVIRVVPQKEAGRYLAVIERRP